MKMCMLTKFRVFFSVFVLPACKSGELKGEELLHAYSKLQQKEITQPPVWKILKRGA